MHYVCLRQRASLPAIRGFCRLARELAGGAEA
jgi:hypothetical protein